MEAMDAMDAVEAMESLEASSSGGTSLFPKLNHGHYGPHSSGRGLQKKLRVDAEEA